MPTRAGGKKYPKKYRKSDAQKDEAAAQNNTSRSSHSKYNAAMELDKLVLHNSYDLTLLERHCLFPAFNVGQAPLSSLDELQVYPSCTISTPYPIYVANRHCERVDICHRRTMERELYRKRLHSSRTRYQSAQKVKRLKTNEKEGTYYTSLFHLAERLQCEPDPYFHGSYDYYYTGGNLCVLGDGEHVLHVDGEYLNNLNVGVLPKFKRFANSFLNPISSLQLKDDDEVFEVRAVSNIRPDCANFFAARRRNTITLHTLEPTGGMKALTRFQTSSTPFISFTQSPVDTSTFLVTTMKQCLRVYDLNTATPILSASHDLCAHDDATRISWNMIRPWKGQTYLYANESKVFIVDTRTTPEQWLQAGGCGYKRPDLGCDFISSIAKSEFRDLAYVATNHKLHCLDLRFLGADLESGASAICHWTHQLEYAPAFMETFRNGGKEFIALSSALADDMSICELTREHVASVVSSPAVASVNETSPDTPRRSKKSIYKSYCLPYQLPTLQAAYQSARVVGKCLQPDADLVTRMKRCSTGLAFYDTGTFSECIGEDDCATFALLLSSNSIGDVYAHRLIESVADDDRQTARGSVGASDENTMHEYGKRVCEVTQPILNYTEIANLKGMRKVFRCNRLSKPLNFDNDDRTKAEEITRKSRGLGRWRKSIQTLQSYKDALAQDLLSIWDIEYDVDNENIKSYSKIKREMGNKPDLETLVSSWLDTNIKPEKSPSALQSTVPASAQIGPLLDSTAMTMVHVPCMETNATIKTETSFSIENNLLDLNTCSFSEFMTDAPRTQQQSTQLLDAIMQMPDSPTEQEEFISLKPKPKPPVKKKSKYVKGF